MTSQKGFTLTEVIIVVATVSLMAAIALPQYAALNSETRQESVTALAAHVQKSAALTNKVWESAGQPDQVVIEGRVIDMAHGYPTEQSIASIVINNGDYAFGNGYWKHQETARNEACAVLYIPPSVDGGQIQVISYTQDC